MPLQATSGAASYDAFGGGVPVVPAYIEEVFSTTLYTGNGSTQTITNGIDLSTKGGLVWVKNRTGADNHILTDSARGTAFFLRSNLSNAQDTNSPSLISALNSNGFSLGVGYTDVNASANNYASWTFRKQPKFFDVVTYTGNSSNNRAISHNLGSTPGCIIVKNITNSADWGVWHRSLSSSQELLLNTTDSAYNYGAFESATSTTFTVNDSGYTNQTGSTYVAYLFAHNAGGFGLTGTDNVISCGSFTMASGVATVNLGYEPQWILAKSTGSSNWIMFDNMRGMPVSGTQARLLADFTQQEYQLGPYFIPSATGFTTSATGFGGGNNETYIYIAIRRGPMKVPTSGTSVFQPYNVADTTTQTVGFPTDMYFDNKKTGASYNTLTGSRLIGTTLTLSTSSTSAETTSWGPSGSFASNTTFAPSMLGAGTVWYSFRRSPSFFDEVCDTGTGSTHTIAHNLGVVPELMIRKSRSQSSTSWYCYVASEGASRRGFLNYDFAWGGPDNSIWGGTTPTSTVFTVGADGNVNNNTSTYVTYLFATCAGVSKVGSYTGTGTTLQIDCGFTGGARFVLIKKTSGTGSWYVWDSSRGIVSGNDPYLLLNSTAAEVTNTDYIDTYSAGFEISSTAPADINASGGTFVFLAIA